MKVSTCVLAAFTVFVLMLMLPQPAMAYVGPGLGLGTIGAVLGIIFSLLLAVFAVLWYPIKRMLGIFKRPRPETERKKV